MPIKMENIVKYNPTEMDKNSMSTWDNRIENIGKHDNLTEMDN
jgi:hypothetical protein